MSLTRMWTWKVDAFDHEAAKEATAAKWTADVRIDVYIS